MAKILIVDDSPVDRLVVKKVLQQAAHEVIELDNPECILKTINQVNPDLILLDIVMPKVNGYEVCRMLKHHEKFASIPLIFLSARAQNSDIFWGMIQGAEDYVTKPFKPVQLLSVVEKWLGDKKDVGVDG